MSKEKLLESILEFNGMLQEASNKYFYDKETGRTRKSRSVGKDAAIGAGISGTLGVLRGHKSIPHNTKGIKLSKTKKIPMTRKQMIGTIALGGAAAGGAATAAISHGMRRHKEKSDRYRDVTGDVRGAANRLSKTGRAGFKVFGTHAKAEGKLFRGKQKIRDKIDEMRGK